MSIVGALPFILQNGTTADATQVMADFNSIKTDVNNNAAQAGANSDITSLSGLTIPLSIAQGGSGTAFPSPFPFAGGFRNLARRNGGLEVWQRFGGGTASAAVTASTTLYTADGWYLNTGPNQACVVAQIAGFGSSEWCARVQRNNGQTGTTGIRFGFPLDSDELWPLLGQHARLSMVLACGTTFSPASSEVVVQLVIGDGAPVKVSAGYTNPTTAISVATAITTTPTRYQFNTATPILTSTRQMEIDVTMTPVGTASTDDSFYIDDVQLEVVPAASGYTASDFERMTFQEQLLLCMRHYQKSFFYGSIPTSNLGVPGLGVIKWLAVSGAGTGAFPRFVTPMRVIPAVVSYNPGSVGAEVYNFTTAVDGTFTAVSNISTQGFDILSTLVAGSAATNTIGVHYTADAGI